MCVGKKSKKLKKKMHAVLINGLVTQQVCTDAAVGCVLCTNSQKNCSVNTKLGLVFASLRMDWFGPAGKSKRQDTME